MVDRYIFSHLVALTKEIKLQEPPDNTGLMSQFMAGRQSPFTFSGGIGLTWWHTRKAIELANTIAALSISKYDSLKNGDRDKLSDVVMGTFPKICLDQDLFNGDDIFLQRKKNLFDARIILDVNSFISVLWERVFVELENSIYKWCFVYPVPRIFSESFNLGYDGISIISKSDTAAWLELIRKYPSVELLNQATGAFRDNRPPSFRNLQYDIYLICKCEGTSSGAKFNAGLKFKRFISVLFSVFQKSSKNFLTKSAAHPYKVCLQFAHKDSTGNTGYVFSEIGEILPYYISDYRIDQEVIDSTKKWYESYSNSDNLYRNKAKKSAHFINHGMNSDDIESFINYFISLDALFGKRGDVERLILEGVQLTTSDDNWRQRAEWLFDLRSELVHGGSRNATEWNKYDRYVNHFKSTPESDVKKLAFICLIKAFQTLPQLAAL